VLNRPAVLLGPARPDNIEALERVLQDGWRVERSPDRSSFARDLLVARARRVVLCDVDRDGIPNAPLLEHCARLRSIEMVVLVHQAPVVRLPSSWLTTSLIVGHVMLSGQSFNEASTMVAELLRGT
jgi:hypothetical protein